MATASIGFSSSTADAHGWRFSYTFHAKRKLLSLMEFRKAMAFAEKKLQIHRLLLSHELRTYAADVFLDRYVDLNNLSASG